MKTPFAQKRERQLWSMRKRMKRRRGELQKIADKMTELSNRNIQLEKELTYKGKTAREWYCLYAGGFGITAESLAP